MVASICSFCYLQSFGLLGGAFGFSSFRVFGQNFWLVTVFQCCTSFENLLFSGGAFHFVAVVFRVADISGVRTERLGFKLSSFQVFLGRAREILEVQKH